MKQNKFNFNVFYCSHGDRILTYIEIQSSSSSISYFKVLPKLCPAEHDYFLATLCLVSDEQPNTIILLVRNI